MISTQKALSAFSTEALNPPTQARYPCVKNFFKLDEIADGSYNAGSNLKQLLDSITGERLLSSAAGGDIHFVAGDGTKMANFGPAYFNSTQGITGGLDLYQDKSTVLMVLATRAAGWDMQVGPIKINTGTSGFDDSVNTENLDSGNIATGTDEMAIVTLDISAAAATGVEVSKTSATARTVVAGTQTGVSADVDLSNYTDDVFDFPSFVTNIYGILVMQFTDLPSTEELDIAAVWMREHWMRGEKVIYPAWLGRN